jgi:hypothetical protein
MTLKMTLEDAREETQKRRQEITIRNLRFPDMDLEEALEKVSKDLREKGHARIGHILFNRRENKDWLYIMEPILNYWRRIRDGPHYII